MLCFMNDECIHVLYTCIFSCESNKYLYGTLINDDIDLLCF